MMLVQQYLLSHSLLDLQKDHGVYARVSTKNPSKISLNYDQIEAKESDKLACECRGLVIRKLDGSPVAEAEVFGESKILGRPFNRFFNEGQESAEKIDYSKSRMLEKLDGTLCILYFDDVLCKWCVATRSVPDADVPINNQGTTHTSTFSDLFEFALKETTGKTLDSFTNEGTFQQYTYLFELTTPVNKVVVNYDEFKVHLLGIIETQTGKEERFPEQIAHMLGVGSPKTYNLSSFAEMIEFISSNNPLNFEGIVAAEWDENRKVYRRVKIKHPGYLALNRVAAGLTNDRALMEIILLGKDDDVLPVMSKYFSERMTQIKINLQNWIEAQEEIFTKLHTPNRKDFAVAIQNTKNAMMSYQMERWNGKTFADVVKKATMPDGAIKRNFADSMLAVLPRLP